MAQKLKLLILLLLLLNWSNLVWATNYCDDGNCQGCWPMEVDEDPLSDSSQNSNTAALGADTASPTYATATPPSSGDGFNGTSVGYYEFDGGDYATISDSATIDFPAALSLVSWAKADNADFSGVLFYRYTNDGYTLRQSTAGSGLWRISVWVNGSEDTADSNDPPSGSWEHIVGVRQTDGTLLIYVDAVLQTDTGSKVGNISEAVPLYIGQNSAGAWKFEGDMDEMAIFDDELTSTEIDDIMTNGLAGAVSARRMFIVS